MSKLQEFEKDIADTIAKHNLDGFAEMHAQVLAKYVTTCIAALKSANKEQREASNG